ncbi:MAG TPA: hypothetical protein VN947_25050 [Polyangia bacterium]|nr:hypothetical protein [Polyangia bacterium]
MYREPPPVCCLCGKMIDAHAADITEQGLRCRRCTEALEVAAMAPALEAAREAQRAWAKIHAAHPVHARRHCSDHAEWDTYCLRCVLAGWLESDD